MVEGTLTAAELYEKLSDEESVIVEKFLALIRESRKKSLGGLVHEGTDRELYTEAGAILDILVALASGIPLEEFIERYPNADVNLAELLAQRPNDDLELGLTTIVAGEQPRFLFVDNLGGENNDDQDGFHLEELPPNVDLNGNGNGNSNSNGVHEFHDFEPSTNGSPEDELSPAAPDLGDANGDNPADEGHPVEVGESEVGVWPEKWQPFLNYWTVNKMIITDVEGTTWISRSEVIALMVKSSPEKKKANSAAQNKLNYHLEQVNKHGGNIISVVGSELQINKEHLYGMDARTHFFVTQNLFKVLDHMGEDSFLRHIVDGIPEDDATAKDAKQAITLDGIITKMGREPSLKDDFWWLDKWLSDSVNKNTKFHTVPLIKIKELLLDHNNRTDVLIFIGDQNAMWEHTSPELIFEEVGGDDRVGSISIGLDLVLDCLIAAKQSKNIKLKEPNFK